MKLGAWRKANEKTQMWVAEYLGVSQSTAWRYESEVHTPNRQVMPKIVKMTGGAVTANDFFEPVVTCDACGGSGRVPAGQGRT
jgi:transcriptional regulator with XRE-family HTH domain